MNVVEFVRSTVTTLTGEEPELEPFEDKYGIVIKVVPTGNIPVLIGRNGKTMRSIQIIASAIGHKGKHRVHVYVEEKDTPSNRD